jgi:hypothetical protein
LEKLFPKIIYICNTRLPTIHASFIPTRTTSLDQEALPVLLKQHLESSEILLGAVKYMMNVLEMRSFRLSILQMDPRISLHLRLAADFAQLLRRTCFPINQENS